MATIDIMVFTIPYTRGILTLNLIIILLCTLFTTVLFDIAEQLNYITWFQSTNTRNTLSELSQYLQKIIYYFEKCRTIQLRIKQNLI